MFFDEIIHGTQYYRAPTPLENEWEEDISKLKNYNIDAFQKNMSIYKWQKDDFYMPNQFLDIKNSR